MYPYVGFPVYMYLYLYNSCKEYVLRKRIKRVHLLETLNIHTYDIIYKGSVWRSTPRKKCPQESFSCLGGVEWWGKGGVRRAGFGPWNSHFSRSQKLFFIFILIFLQTSPKHVIQKKERKKNLVLFIFMLYNFPLGEMGKMG